jgi:hypothetical protein
MHKNGRPDDHQRFRELSALAQGGECSDSDWLELKRHLQMCSSCREAYSEYSLIANEGMLFLAAARGYTPECKSWDKGAAWSDLRSRIREMEQPQPTLVKVRPPVPGHRFLPWCAGQQWAAAAVVAFLIVAASAGAYRLGNLSSTAIGQGATTSSAELRQFDSERRAASELLASQTTQMSRLQKQVSSEQQELSKLRAALRAAEDQFRQLSTGIGERNEQLRRLSDQRDRLVSQLRDVEQVSQKAQAELSSLHAEHDRTLLRTTSLESKIEELTASNRDQERRLGDDKQFLASDRDIRELMGARKLYIADVFDVDSGSRTRKPFGRVFYTQNKSLVFYAFDLDHEPGVKTASAFQVWGERDAEFGEKSRAKNLGILYMDSESNRRWVLRFDDPKHLAEIDAVFVTVEPHGGSQKPTGKPFLYALLRKEANHP